MKPIQTSRTILSFLTEENVYGSATIVPATQDNNTTSINSTINQFQASLGTTNQFMPIVNSTATSQEYFNPLPSPMYDNNLESIMGNENEVRHLCYVHQKVLIQCDLCGKFFKTRQKIKRHCEIHFRNK
ncbi:hypothetical protein ACKWTF_008193 [Chironomus riparius]